MQRARGAGAVQRRGFGGRRCFTWMAYWVFWIISLASVASRDSYGFRSVPHQRDDQPCPLHRAVVSLVAHRLEFDDLLEGLDALVELLQVELDLRDHHGKRAAAARRRRGQAGARCQGADSGGGGSTAQAGRVNGWQGWKVGG